ncbi:MAG: NAD+ synthase [Roseibacillus sp.]|nr:NAD+ synthase [Roseibacillus sp.]|tara:strand:- start:180 stop:1835 length:1656 start_codon:yes stop_codon:yes gene_type:complete
MKIGLAQINSTVGDFPSNAKRIVSAYREALDQGAELVIVPEMALVGYPPRDLVFKSGFVDKCLQALDYLKGEIGAVPLVVGYVDHNEKQGPGKPFRNGAAFLVDGEIRDRIFKTLLPTYDIFDERRYFEPSEQCQPVEWKGRRIGITICEDVWTEDFLHRPLYKRDPVKELMEMDVEFILNLSASPYHLGKGEVRRELLGALAEKSGVPFVYCNSVGGNDQLIFDGGSLVMSSEGVPLMEMPPFDEEVAVAELFEGSPSHSGARSSRKRMHPDEEIFRALVLGVRDYIHKCGFETACIGLSGGIDSALTAAVAVEAIGADNVLGITMPSPYSSRGSVDDSLSLAANLGIRCETVPIAETFEAVRGALAPIFQDLPEDVTEENMQARIRGLYLMSLSNKFNHLLLTTGNKSELAVGYCTIYGDMCGGLAVISDLPKTRVFSVARWLNRDQEIIPWNTIEKPPSAELRPDQKDEDTLPSYEVLDEILEFYVEKQLSPQEIVENHGFEEKTVLWVQRQVDLNEWKRHQAAPGLRVTSKAFGIGRRIPIVQRFGR